MSLPSGYEEINTLKYRTDGIALAAVFDKNDNKEFIIAKIKSADGSLYVVNHGKHDDSKAYPQSLLYLSNDQVVGTFQIKKEFSIISF